MASPNTVQISDVQTSEVSWGFCATVFRLIQHIIVSTKLLPETSEVLINRIVASSSFQRRRSGTPPERLVVLELLVEQLNALAGDPEVIEVTRHEGFAENRSRLL